MENKGTEPITLAAEVRAASMAVAYAIAVLHKQASNGEIQTEAVFQVMKQRVNLTPKLANEANRPKAEQEAKDLNAALSKLQELVRGFTRELQAPSNAK